MRCVPIFTKKITDEFYQAWILLERQGTEFIYMDSVDDAKLFVEENGIVVTNIEEEGDVLYMLVDHQNTKLDHFYSWGESVNDVWRPFVWYIPKTGEDDLHINICHMATPFGEVLNTYFKRYIV
jgi:hypothetical protein